MPCPTCDHTMSGLGNGFAWCPSCGTILQEDSACAPALVRRCREFGDTLGPRWAELWQQLGISESIHCPEQRPQIGA